MLNPVKPLTNTLEEIAYLFKAPFLIAFMYAINWMTNGMNFDGYMWAHWAALGIGLSWCFTVISVVQRLIVGGAAVAIGLAVWRKFKRG